MTRVSETEQRKPAQPRLGEKNATGLARTELYASLLSNSRAVKVAAAPLSAVAEGSSVGGRPVPSVASAHLQDLPCVARTSCPSASVEISAGLVYSPP